jgi:hypothetical protein
VIRFDASRKPILPGPKFCPYCCGEKTAQHLRFIGNIYSPVLRIAMRCDCCEKEYESRVVVRREDIVKGPQHRVEGRRKMYTKKRQAGTVVS